MSEGKYGKYIITDYKEKVIKNEWAPTYRTEDKMKLLRLDDDIVPGAKMFVESSWFWPAMVENESLERSSKPHSHTYDEIIGMVGTNPDDLYDLGGECEMTLNGEKNIVTKSCLLYLPTGFEHGPFREVKMTRPIFQFECGLNGKHT
jgi:hypothetical protein